MQKTIEREEIITRLSVMNARVGDELRRGGELRLGTVKIRKIIDTICMGYSVRIEIVAPTDRVSLTRDKHEPYLRFIARAADAALTILAMQEEQMKSKQRPVQGQWTQSRKCDLSANLGSGGT